MAMVSGFLRCFAKVRWLPRFRLSDTLMCFDDGEAEGPLLIIEWGRFIVEIAVARRTRVI